MYSRFNRLYLDTLNTYSDSRLNKKLVNSTRESELAAYVPMTSFLENKLSNISADVRHLQEAKHTIEARIIREAPKNGPMVVEMNALIANMRDLLKNLEPLNEFWQEHKDFFRGYKKAEELEIRYKKELENSRDKDFIKRSIMSTAALKGIEYPYISFVNGINNDMKTLAQYKQKVYHYASLFKKIETVNAHMKELFDMIVMMPEYATERDRKKQHELEQERIAIERQKAEAERQKAEAMAKQAAAEREKVHAMYQQAAAEREKAQAIKEQTLMHMTQPKPQPQHININVQTPHVSQPLSPTPVVPPSKPIMHQPLVQPQPVVPSSMPSPSYGVSKLFEAIENIMPSALNRLDFHMPQLEQQYGHLDQAFINNHSLISAAIEAKHLSVYNKAELIGWLKNYGVKPTHADEQKARQTGQQEIITAVLA